MNSTVQHISLYVVYVEFFKPAQQVLTETETDSKKKSVHWVQVIYNQEPVPDYNNLF